MDPKIKKIIGGVMCIFGIFLILFGIFLILSAPIWTVRYFEMMLITLIIGVAVSLIGVAVSLIGLLVVIYGLLCSKNKE